MDKLQLLERYFQTFTNQKDAKQFFLGMAEYLDYGDTIAEFNWITSQVSVIPQPLMDRYEAQERAAMEKINDIHKEIVAYIGKKKIDNQAVNASLAECGGILSGHVSSSIPKPSLLHLRLYDIMQVLHSSQEHKVFAEKYAVFSDTNRTQPREWVFVPELKELTETKDELERQHEDSVWGAQSRLYELRDIIRNGRDTHKEIVDRFKRGEVGASFDMLNFGVVMGEWVNIEEGNDKRNLLFFNIEKVLPKAQRFHMYVVAHFAEAHAAMAEKKQEKHLTFDEAASILWVKNTPFRIRRESDQYDLLRVIFADVAEVGKEWFFSEIAEKVDHVRPRERLKKYYNAAYQIKQKLSSKGFADFFNTSSHSVRINKQYLT